VLKGKKTVEDFSLQVKMRDESFKGNQLRTRGATPAVVYGAKKSAQNVQIDSRELDRLLARGGATHLIDLEGEAFPKTRVLIREIQRHPVRREVLHVDFVRVSRDQKIRMAVPLHLIGEAPAVEEGAVLLQNVDALEIECLPDDLPAFIEVDVSGMAQIHDRIYASNVKLPPNVTLHADHGDELLVSLSLPRSAAAEEAEEEGVGVAEPEILTERRAEDES
jgi:large subunit ribosomal protein L25